MKKVLITGVSSGLGYALSELFLSQGDRIYGISRGEPKGLLSHPNFFFSPYDLSQTFTLQSEVAPFLQHHRFDLVILNAGKAGELKPLTQTDPMELKEIMEINLWGNKELIDAIMLNADANQIVAISSGAAVNGNKGWGGYAISKAALNMLIKLYAKDYPQVHFSAIAPGVIDTPMLRSIIEEADELNYPSVKRLKEGEILTAQKAAKRLVKAIDKVKKEYPSGEFVDVRQMALD